MNNNRYREYLQILNGPFQKVVRLEFLNPDNSVAFSLGGWNNKEKTTQRYATKAFVQSGSLSVSLNNGQRRKATITLSNLDGAFDYNVNNIWFGRQVRLLMGVLLRDDTEFYLPQGVFYIKDPQTTFKPNEKSVTFPLYDKWSYLDGTLAGKIGEAYKIEVPSDEELSNGATRPNVFEAMKNVLRLSKYDHLPTTNKMQMIDPIEPVFTNYYTDETYNQTNSDGTVTENISYTELPYTIIENAGGNYGKLLLQLNDTYVGLIGYDQTGALRVDPSQDDISDAEKPVLWNFTPYNSQLLGVSETIKNSEVYNHIVVVGEGLSGGEVWGSASNYDPSSDTNINLIGIKPYYERKAEYWNSKQCADLAEWLLKRKTVLQKSINIECSQMFHLMENYLVTVQRTDKKGKPVERHLINSFTIPIGETGNMTINATSVNDLVEATIEKYPEHILPMEYQQVEYIESNSGQYINTQILANENNSFELKAQLTDFSASQSFFGGRQSSSGSLQGNQLHYAFSNNALQYIFCNSISSYNVIDSDIHIYQTIGGTLYRDNIELGALTSAPITESNNILLFATNTNGSTQFTGKGLKLFYFKIWNSGTLVRNFVPCYRIADGEIGLYDLVGNTFYENQGTGSFLKGENIG